MAKRGQKFKGGVVGPTSATRQYLVHQPLLATLCSCHNPSQGSPKLCYFTSQGFVLRLHIPLARCQAGTFHWEAGGTWPLLLRRHGRACRGRHAAQCYRRLLQLSYAAKVESSVPNNYSGTQF